MSATLASITTRGHKIIAIILNCFMRISFSEKKKIKKMWPHLKELYHNITHFGEYSRIDLFISVYLTNLQRVALLPLKCEYLFPST